LTIRTIVIVWAATRFSGVPMRRAAVWGGSAMGAENAPESEVDMRLTKAIVSKIALGSIILAAAVTATTALAAGPAGGKGCGPRNCLDVWRPVLCPNGQIYSNDCYAARACQTGCTPAGAI